MTVKCDRRSELLRCRCNEHCLIIVGVLDASFCIVLTHSFFCFVLIKCQPSHQQHNSAEPSLPSTNLPPLEVYQFTEMDVSVDHAHRLVMVLLANVPLVHECLIR